LELSLAPAAVAGEVFDRAVVVGHQPLDFFLVHAESHVVADFVAAAGRIVVQHAERPFAGSALMKWFVDVPGGFNLFAERVGNAHLEWAIENHAEGAFLLVVLDDQDDGFMEIRIAEAWRSDEKLSAAGWHWSVRAYAEQRFGINTHKNRP